MRIFSRPKHDAVPDPDRDKLKATMALHGFQFAAKEFNERINCRQALRAWDDYPACMDRYPTHVKAVREKPRAA